MPVIKVKLNDTDARPPLAWRYPPMWLDPYHNVVLTQLNRESGNIDTDIVGININQYLDKGLKDRVIVQSVGTTYIP